MTTQVVVMGTDLFSVAAQYLGDATQWVRIAQQNGNLQDPFISQMTTLTIPDVDLSQTGGIPQQG
jgi:hypothetical protein